MSTQYAQLQAEMAGGNFKHQPEDRQCTAVHCIALFTPRQAERGKQNLVKGSMDALDGACLTRVQVQELLPHWHSQQPLGQRGEQQDVP